MATARKKTRDELLHMLDQETGKHQAASGGAGGCLVRHVIPYEEKNVCSHSYKAYMRA